MPIIGYANGAPVYDNEDEIETRAIVHDPHSGQFTSGGGGSAGGKGAGGHNPKLKDGSGIHGSPLGASLVKAHADHIAGGHAQNHKGDYVTVGKGGVGFVGGKPATAGQSPVFSNHGHVGHVSDHPSGGTNAHHQNGTTTHHASQHDAISALKESSHASFLASKGKKKK